MHFIFATRGIQQQIDLFKMFMQTQMFPWKRKNLNLCVCGQIKQLHNDAICSQKTFTPREELIQIQGSLRPIQLWDYVFPDTCLDEVLTITQPHWKIANGTKGKFMQAAARAILGNDIKPVPEFKPVQTLRYIENHGVALYPIGIKEDVKNESQGYGFEQEML